jgi:glycosyltransferase involved in cell wall biosynthesis
MAKLSICIPTHNRAPFLAWGLKRLRADFPDAEIIVSDNASTDNTSDLKFSADIRYHRQTENIGAFPNFLAALQLATGQYAIYCGDDDYLLPDRVSRGTAYLDAHPEVAAYCAPCELYLEEEGKPYCNAFKVPEPQTFTADEGKELFNFIIREHVWPEHMIYRAPVPLSPRTSAYWAFADLPSILATGAIHFAPEPFYRNLLGHPMGHRDKLGDSQFLTHFDEYRAGLQVLAYDLFGERLSYAGRRHVTEMIEWFICVRLDLARIHRERQGDTAEAEILAKRIAIENPAREAAEAA